MTYSLIINVPRRPDLTPEQFKHHWEHSHVPLLKSLVGHDFPLSHTRHYVETPPAGPIDPALGGKGQGSNEHTPAAAISEVDGVAVLTFADKEHYARFMGKLGAKGRKEAHEGDLERFVDVGRLRGVVVGETKATGRDGGIVGWRFVGSV